MLLACSFAIILTLKQRQRSVNNKYLKTDCASIYSTYGEAYVQEHAVQSWFDYYSPSANQTHSDYVSPIVPCFCQHQKKVYKNKLAFTNFTDSEGHRAYVCYEFVTDAYKNQGIQLAISVVINAVNWIMKFVLIITISNIGEDKKSE